MRPVRCFDIFDRAVRRGRRARALRMSGSNADQITELLEEWGHGSESALDDLLSAVYAELRAIAARQLRGERPDHTLQPTALVNEAFLRLVDQKRMTWESRAQFFAFAATAMRRILVDHARKRRAEKRGGDPARVTLEQVEIGVGPEADLIDLDDCLRRLAEIDPQQARIVELRFFAGCTMEEAAEVLELSPSTAKRKWRVARIWLHAELVRETAVGS